VTLQLGVVVGLASEFAVASEDFSRIFGSKSRNLARLRERSDVFGASVALLGLFGQSEEETAEIPVFESWRGLLGLFGNARWGGRLRRGVAGRVDESEATTPRKWRWMLFRRTRLTVIASPLH
jgi:hypothetical protein